MVDKITFTDGRNDNLDKPIIFSLMIKDRTN